MLKKALLPGFVKQRLQDSLTKKTPFSFFDSSTATQTVRFVSSFNKSLVHSNNVTTMATTDIQYIRRTTETVLDVAHDVIMLLREAGETVGVAESLTAGDVMAALTSVPGASQAFRGGIVAYATPLKQLLLGVDAGLIAREGVIHADVADQMAEGARKATTFDDNIPTTWGIGTTGVAGPDLQDGKPAGTVFIGIAGPKGSMGLGPFMFPGSRDQVRKATVIEALSRLREVLILRSPVQYAQ
jgi:PncC family amidohydrolase